MAIPLSRYAEIVQYRECAFNGVNNDPQDSACRMFWTEAQRQEAEGALIQAQVMLEDYIRYFLCPQWVIGDLRGDARLFDSQPFRRNPIITRWGMVHEGGIVAQSMLQTGATVSYDVEPAAVTVTGVTISDLIEPAIFHANQDRGIMPSDMSYNGTTLVIRIPRCRLVKPELLDQITNDVGLDYNDLNNFVNTVDVVRIYNNPATQAVFVKDNSCGSNLCDEQTQAGCIRVKQPRVGIVQVAPGTYTDGAWRSAGVCGAYDTLRLNYRAGLMEINRDIENVIVRLAHTLMAEEACGCDVVRRLWQRDNYKPEIATRERMNNPFGLSDGAWFAWQWARRHALGRSSVYGGN